MKTADAPAGRFRRIRLICIIAAGLLALGLWANLPYLVAEHRRLEWWKLAGLLVGDLMGLVWFLRFVLEHAVLGEPLVPISPGLGWRNLRVVILAVSLPMLFDLAVTFMLMADERDGYTRGIATEARVTVIKEHRRPEATGYDLDCTFRDRASQLHQAHLRVLAPHHLFPEALPAQAVRVLSTRGEGQKTIPIRYDPRLPERAWIDGLGWQDENGLYWFSIGALALQAAVTAVFLLLLNGWAGSGQWPWWWDLYKVLPLAAEVFCLMGMGLIDRFMDWLG